MTSLRRGGLVSFRAWGVLGACLVVAGVSQGAPPPETRQPPQPKTFIVPQRPPRTTGQSLEAQIRELESRNRQLQRQTAALLAQSPLGTPSYDACLVAVPADLDPRFVVPAQAVDDHMIVAPRVAGHYRGRLGPKP